jgi:hypothetical protein
MRILPMTPEQPNLLPPANKMTYIQIVIISFFCICLMFAVFFLLSQRTTPGFRQYSFHIDLHADVLGF